MEDNKKVNTQALFFNKIKDLVPSNYSLVDELVDILDISRDSAYRRLRGETSLTIDEVDILCNHFKISFDIFSNHRSDTVSFSTKKLNTIEDFKNHLIYIRETLKTFKKTENSTINYAAFDVPIFYNFNLSELSAFKMFYWMKSVINEDIFEGKKFEKECVPDELLNIGKEIYNLYMDINSVEIWNSRTITSLIKQIEYYWDSGLFKNEEDAIIICNQISELLDSIQLNAEKGSKNNINKNYLLYISEVEIGNNSIYVTMGESKIVILSHNSLNLLTTTNTSFCNETGIWIDNLIKKSILISQVSEKQRFQFFRKAQKSIKQLRDKIECF